MLAVGLAVIGVYGLTSYVAEVRSYELSLRMALGASTSNVVLVLLKELGAISVIASVGGLAIGARAVALVNSAIETPTLGAPALSLPIIPVIAGIASLVAVGAVGTFVPIRRLLRQDIARILQGN
jgi:ABC-type antimicrobial peptide transport system permease subunit